MKNRSFKKGFTLIELLVVVAIISLLASVIIASLNSARGKARNAQRVEEIKQLVTAFDLGLNDHNNTLPIPVSTPYPCISATCYGSWSAFTADATTDAFLAPEIPQKPIDPPDATRGLGGYIFRPAWPGGIAPYSGIAYGPGDLIVFMVEPPVGTSSCGPGFIFAVTANYVECLTYI